MKSVIATAVIVTALATAVAFAADPMAVAAARMASDICSKCHGQNGASTSSLFPRLAGQQAGYIDYELKLFRSRGRSDPHAQAYMWGIAGPLTDAQIAALAAYYAAKRPVPGTPPSDPALAAKGKALYDQGAPDRGIPACASCHGPDAEGKAEIPRLAGQHADYLLHQISDFRSSHRESTVMHENTKSITDDEATALAEYLASK